MLKETFKNPPYFLRKLQFPINGFFIRFDLQLIVNLAEFFLSSLYYMMIICIFDARFFVIIKFILRFLL